VLFFNKFLFDLLVGVFLVYYYISREMDNKDTALCVLLELDFLFFYLFLH